MKLNLRQQGWTWFEIILWGIAFLFLMSGLLAALNPEWRKDNVVLNLAIGYPF